MILCNDDDLYKKINSAVFPGTQGGPLEHIIAAKAVCLGEALKPEFRAYGRQVAANAGVLAEKLIEQGFRLVSGGHGQPSDSGGHPALWPHRQGV